MKRALGLLIFLFLLTGCSENTTEYTKQIEKLEKENQELKKHINELALKNTELEEENKQLETTRTNVQLADLASKRIMRYIANGDFDKLKEEYNAEFELIENRDEILFTKLDNNMSFPTKIFDAPMYIASIVTTEAGTDIGYLISHDPNEGALLVYFKYDKDMNFEYIASGH
ncbi:cell division protein ZapB [Paenibacillus marinisediminis]